MTSSEAAPEPIAIDTSDLHVDRDVVVAALDHFWAHPELRDSLTLPTATQL